MSGILGADSVSAQLDAYGEAVGRRLDGKVTLAAQQMQRDLVSLAPVWSGRLRDALASPDAVEIGTRAGRAYAIVGFRTLAQTRAAFHGYFVEFGTKGYQAGAARAAGKDRHGRQRTQKVKTYVPARPAHPFFRPALAMLRENMSRMRREAHVEALADVAGAGLARALERA